jgi:predicted Ser/Thr protein kinase
VRGEDRQIAVAGVAGPRITYCPAVADADDLVTAPALDTTADSGPPGPSVPTELPAMIDRFEVKAKLGEGGMGVVMLAADPVLGRKVAIKVLHAGDGSARTDAQRRLLREAQGMAQLAHDNVIVVHEVGTHEGRVFLAMEYITGGTLAKHQVGRPWRELLDLYVRAGRGLQAAHDAGLVHRDFKPDNVLVGDDGRVRVTDFGLVASIGAGPALPGAVGEFALSTKLTQTGAVMGTPRYMAPEQHLGESVDPRADQFAFCVALHEAIYGRPPFPGPSYADLRRQVLAGAPSLGPARADVPGHVRAALARGLSRDREARFPSMRALLDALTAPPARVPRWRWARPLVAATVVIAGLATFALTRSPDEAPPASPRPAPARAPDLDEAGAAFDAAQAAYLAGRYDEAAQGFQRAYAIASLPQFLFNVGASYQMLAKRTGDIATYAKAIASYQRYLAEDPQAQDRARIEASIAALISERDRIARGVTGSAMISEQQLDPQADVRLRGLVVIDSDPAGATILVDAKRTPFGLTPWSGWLEGKHHVIIERAGYRSLEHDLVVDPRKLIVFHAVLAKAE